MMTMSTAIRTSLLMMPLAGSGAAETGTARSAEGQARVVSGKGGVHVLTVAEASR